MYATIAIHHVRPAHADAFRAFLGRIEDGMAGTPGLVSLESYEDPRTGDLVAVGRWESAEAAQAGVPRLLAIGGRDPEWSSASDDVLFLPSLR